MKKFKRYFYGFLIGGLVAGCLYFLMDSKGKPPYQDGENRLGDEKSPYLLQHAQNPIWWYPWGEAAFDAAKKEQKPIFLSIGYSTCYWCHFMEKDSFEKDDVADLLNSDFIAIKVDREERPDVDYIYMTALVAIRGRGGWPMSLFLTPEGHPFYADSTIRHDAFIQLLHQISTDWMHDSDQLRHDGALVMNQIDFNLNIPQSESTLDGQIFSSFLRHTKNQYDAIYGGFGMRNKFPKPHVLRLLLRLYRQSEDPEILTMITTTLDGMARGGIHDVLAGGFHRYSVDRVWNIPHFEKMLYDNAGLALTYLEAYQLTGDSEYADVARKLLDWVMQTMTHPDGGYYSALDAGELNKEGEYYVWSYDELKSLLNSEELNFVTSRFQVTQSGNFEYNTNVFHVPSHQNLPTRQDALYGAIESKLLKERQGRQLPRLDDKVITAWNGFMISAMAKGYQVLQDERYLKSAQRAALFIKNHLRNQHGQLFRRWRDDQADKDGVVDDYAYMIDGLIELYQSDFNPDWLYWAVELQEIQDDYFWDVIHHGYYLVDGQDSTLLSRPKEFSDGAMPAGNSVAAHNLLRLYAFTYDRNYKNRVTQLFDSAAAVVSRSPTGYAHLLLGFDYYHDDSKDIVIVGRALNSESTQQFLRYFRSSFFPNQVIAVSVSLSANSKIMLLKNKPVSDTTVVYMCDNGQCMDPVSELSIIQSMTYNVRPRGR